MSVLAVPPPSPFPVGAMLGPGTEPAVGYRMHVRVRMESATTRSSSDKTAFQRTPLPLLQDHCCVNEIPPFSVDFSLFLKKFFFSVRRPDSSKKSKKRSGSSLQAQYSYMPTLKQHRGDVFLNISSVVIL